MCSSPENYEHKFKLFFSEITNENYIIELTKCCGYSKFVILYKHLPLSMVYYMLRLEFGGSFGDLQLFVKNGEKNVVLPSETNLTLFEFIQRNVSLFSPIYPIPLKTVYRIFYKDGLEKEHHH